MTQWIQSRQVRLLTGQFTPSDIVAAQFCKLKSNTDLVLTDQGTYLP